VHRVDAQQAVGQSPGPIEPALAVDGIDEVFSVFVPAFAADRSPGDGRAVHLHATDVQREWLIAFEQDQIVVEASHGNIDANAALHGPAAELLLWLWGRLPLDRLEVSGTREWAAVLRQVTTF
jgi:predicted lipid carrier protein YhbT